MVEVKCEDTFHGELEGARVQVSDARECESQLESIDALTVASSGDVSGDQGLARLDEWLQASQRVESRLAQIQEVRHARVTDSKQRGAVRRIRRPVALFDDGQDLLYHIVEMLAHAYVGLALSFKHWLRCSRHGMQRGRLLRRHGHWLALATCW